MRHRLVQILACSFLLYSFVALAVFLAQRKLIYPARGSGATPQLAGATLETIAGASGRNVYALYARAPEDAVTLVHFHGNGEELADMVDLVAVFRKRGLGVLAVEYPGYGLSRENEPNETALYEDAEAALRDLIEKKAVPRDRIALSGQSLGTGVAVEMARRGYGARVVLFSPYTSMAEAAAKFVPFLPTRLLVRDAFDSAAKAPDIRTPVLVVHGTADEVIPFALGRKLSGLFPNARLVPIENGKHTDLFERGPAMVDEVVAFVRGER